MLTVQTRLYCQFLFTSRKRSHSVHRGVVSQYALQVSRPTPRGEVEGSGGLGVSRPTPRGKLRVWLGVGLQAHTQGGVERSGRGGLQAHTQGVCIPACTEADTPLQQTATAAGGTHPTGMHSCSQSFSIEKANNVTHHHT